MKYLLNNCLIKRKKITVSKNLKKVYNSKTCLPAEFYITMVTHNHYKLLFFKKERIATTLKKFTLKQINYHNLLYRL